MRVRYSKGRKEKDRTGREKGKSAITYGTPPPGQVH